MKFNTKELESILRLAVRLISHKLSLSSQVVRIFTDNGILCFAATDGLNSVIVKSDTFGELDVCVDKTMLYNLIKNTTMAEVELELKDNILVVKGNGVYKIPITLNEDGTKYLLDDDRHLFVDTGRVVNKVDLSNVIRSCKKALLPSDKYPTYHNYLFSDVVIGTDSYIISAYNKNVFGKDMLVDPAFIDLSNVIDGEEFKLFETEDKIMLCNDRYFVITSPTLDISDFNKDAVKNFIEIDLPYSCTVNTNDLLSALNRIKIFTDMLDNGGIVMEFGNELVMSSQNKQAKEIINVSGEEFRGIINSRNLQVVIESYPSEDITIEYGIENAIRIVLKDYKHIIALQEE